MIKLSKVGKTNKKVFRLIISEKGRDPYGRALEILGAYNPYSKELQVKGDRVKYWLSKGAGMTATVNNLLITKEVIEGNKVTASKKGKVNEKRVAQLQAKADKKKASEAEASVAPETEAKEENPATEEVAETKEEAKQEAEKTE